MIPVLMLIWNAFYFLLPAYFGNMAPVLMKKVPFLNTPVDFGKKLKKKRIFGNHKTWRGLFFAPIFGVIIFQIQRILPFNSFINYSQYTFAQGLLFGFLLGFGAVLGDLIESFFKRRINIKPGKPWIPFDQIDLVIGAILLTFPLYPYSLLEMAVMIVLTFVLNIIVNQTAFIIKIRSTRI